MTQNSSGVCDILVQKKGPLKLVYLIGKVLFSTIKLQISVFMKLGHQQLSISEKEKMGFVLSSRTLREFNLAESAIQSKFDNKKNVKDFFFQLNS